MTVGALIPLNAQAARWGWKPQKLYRLCAGRRVPFVKIGRSIYFEQDALDRWIADLRSGTSQQRHDLNRADECARLGIPELHEFA